MRYKAVFTDEFLSYFRLDDNGKTLILTDRQGHTRAVTLEVEVEPKRGKWIPKTLYPLSFSDGECKDCVQCSNCKTHWDIETNYCPNCGAKMDE